MILELVPLGDLKSVHKAQALSNHEIKVVLEQGLLALAYLHGQKPPVAHRDIKPQNLLIKSRDPFHLKMGDFGLSKTSESLKTACGTPLYMAPEILETRLDRNKRYTVAVDIWSLGVVVLQYAYGLPLRGHHGTIRGCVEIVEKLVNLGDDQLNLKAILLKMIVMDPEHRESAGELLERMRELGITSRTTTPTRETTPTLGAIKEPDEIQHDRTKRPRSPGGHREDHSRRVKPFTHAFSVSPSSLRQLLKSMQEPKTNSTARRMRRSRF